MQYVFFNNDSRFYKINVNLLNSLKDISTQGTSVILCAWWLGLYNFAKVTPSSPPPSDAYGRHSYISVPCMLT